jgi:hypothetical protein
MQVVCLPAKHEDNIMLNISADQKEKLINQIVEWDYQVEADDLIELWKEKIEERGYRYPDIRYSGFWSQGDGASFTSDYLDLAQWMRYNKLGSKYRALYNKAKDNYFRVEVYRSHHLYSHEYTVKVLWECYYDVPNKVLWDMEDNVVSMIQDEVVDLSRQIYKELRELYDYLTSDEYIAQRLESEETLMKLIED